MKYKLNMCQREDGKEIWYVYSNEMYIDLLMAYLEDDILRGKPPIDERRTIYEGSSLTVDIVVDSKVVEKYSYDFQKIFKNLHKNEFYLIYATHGTYNHVDMISWDGKPVASNVDVFNLPYNEIDDDSPLYAAAVDDKLYIGTTNPTATRYMNNSDLLWSHPYLHDSKIFSVGLEGE